MGRLPRPIADGLVYHALNRGNNRAVIFRKDGDYAAFLKALAQTKERYPFRLYGYCLMTNHFHLILEPEAGQSISRILQSLTVAHTWHFHKAHRTVGHVWQGRFRSPVIQQDGHLLTVLRYVEANPLRAGMVADLAAYPWSSYGLHGLGRADPLVCQAPVWEGLAKTESARQAYWRKWVHKPITERELTLLRRAVTSGRPFGDESWVTRMAATLTINLAPRPRGRPRKHSRKMNCSEN
jgi:putative transposase